MGIGGGGATAGAKLARLLERRLEERLLRADVFIEPPTLGCTFSKLAVPLWYEPARAFLLPQHPIPQSASNFPPSERVNCLPARAGDATPTRKKAPF